MPDDRADYTNYMTSGVTVFFCQLEGDFAFTSLAFGSPAEICGSDSTKAKFAVKNTFLNRTLLAFGGVEAVFTVTRLWLARENQSSASTQNRNSIVKPSHL